MAVKNRLKDRVKTFEKFLKEGKVSPKGYYPDEIKRTKKLLTLIKENKLTPSKFDKLNTRDKWDIHWSKLLKNITWHCGRCKCKTTVESPFMGELFCGNCDALLSARTNGGQSNPFNWIFKRKK